MAANQSTCPDCGKPTIPKEDWSRLTEGEKERVCQCVVERGCNFQTAQAVPGDSQPVPGKSTRAGESCPTNPVARMVARKPWPDLIGWVMGAFGVVIFCLGLFGCAFSITFFVISNKVNLQQISLNPREGLFIQIGQSLVLVVGGSVMYLLARIGHMLRRVISQNER